MGLTPYGAAQFTTFDLPAYAENALVGSNAFALSYGARSVTDTRSELGLRADKSFVLTDAILTLRSRAAWAHDFNPDRAPPPPSRRCRAHLSSSTARHKHTTRRSPRRPPK